ncbi:MAG TPA: hypothetical protein VGV59_16410 [Pyrinomonadaceae bacterium]|nr:hypothetical protein [Pyrinomonadaceae bacterium]
MSEGSKVRRRIAFARELLLVEIERYCADAQCHARTGVGLTKEEARFYTGFECERCGLWNEDALAERDIPEWWEELKITSLDGLRPARIDASEASEEATGEVVRRLSDAWRRDAQDSSDENLDGEDSF